jgi:hypothetical protein
MALPRPGGALILAARALGGASTAAHFAFLTLYAWRLVIGRGFRAVSLVLAILAGCGLVLSFVGGALLKHGGRTRARSIGVWLVGASTALASLLLVFTSSGD